MTGLSDGALLRATVQGDADAYATLFRRHVSAVTGFALRRVRNAHEAADLVGDTFLAALEAAPRYREELPTALPWLLGIARRLWMSQMRRDHRLDRLRSRVGGSMPRFEAAEEDDVVEAIDAARQRPEIEAALERLSCGERDVLELVALHGLSPQEAAIALDVSANAARLRLSRAPRRMRSMIDGHSALDWSGIGAELA